MIKRNLLGLVLIIAACVTVSDAQNILNSPYSRLGMGDIENQNYMGIASMGGLGSSWSESYQINNVNPASLPYLRAAAFEIGLTGERKRLDDGNNSTQQWGGRLRYMGLAFPLLNPINEIYEGIKKDYKFGMGFNISRRTTLGYDITSIDSTDQIGVFNRSYSGQGGTYELAWSNGVLYKGFSLGVKLGYLFGNESFDKRIVFEDKDYAFDNITESSYFVKGFTYNLGLMYTKFFGDVEKTPEKANRLSVGLTYNHGSKLSIIGDEFAYSRQYLTSNTAVIDTIYGPRETRGSGFMPGNIGFGANLVHGNKWGIGFDVSQSDWGQYYHELKGDVKNELSSATNVSLGGFVRPDYKSYDNYFKRMSYRWGVYYQKDPRVISEVQLTDYGMNIGLGLPFIFQRKSSSANISLDLGRKGEGTLIEENYMRINFGFVFNDEDWFIKRKYN